MDHSDQIAKAEQAIKALENRIQSLEIVHGRRLRLLEEQNDRLHAAVFQRRLESMLARVANLIRRIRLAIWGKEIAKC